MSQVFDPYQAILEEHLFGDDGDVLSHFLEEQVKLHSLNKLSGKIFNPVGFAASLIQSSENDFVRSILARSASDIIEGGAFETSDGITFSRVADSDGGDVFYDSVHEFKEDADGSNSFAGRAISGAIQRVASSIGIETSGIRSILGQVLAYNASDIQNRVKGTQTKLKALYGENQPQLTGKDTAVQIDPIGQKVIGYTHDMGEFLRNPLKLVKLQRDITNGLYAQNVMVPKSQDIRDAEANIAQADRNRKASFMERFGLNFLRDRILDLEQEPDFFYVNRMVEHDPMTSVNPISGSPSVEKDIVSIHEVWLDQFRKNDGESTEDLMSVYTWLQSNTLFDFIQDIGVESDFQKIEEGRIEKMNERPELLDDTNNMSQHTEVLRTYGMKDILDRNRQHKYSVYKSMMDEVNVTPDDPVFVSDITKQEGEFNSDLLTINERGAREFIYMSFQDIRNGKLIYLRPTLSSINEDIQANYSTQLYLGRTEPIPNYEQTVRTLSFSFTLAPRTPNEYLMMWKKIEFLNSLNYPVADEDFRSVQSPLVKFTLGDIYKNLGGYITSFSKTILEDAPWETEVGYVAPKIMECGMTMIILHDTMPYVPLNNEFGNNGFRLHTINFNEDV